MKISKENVRFYMFARLHLEETATAIREQLLIVCREAKWPS